MREPENVVLEVFGEAESVELGAPERVGLGPESGEQREISVIVAILHCLLCCQSSTSPKIKHMLTKILLDCVYCIPSIPKT